MNSVIHAILAALKLKPKEVSKTAQEVAAEAYQVIGALADHADLFEHEPVRDALDYFGDIASGKPGERFKGDILPWPKPKEDKE